MLDNIKLIFKNKNEVEDWYFANKHKFPFAQKKYYESKDKQYVTYPLILEIENLRLKITEKQAVLEGSIHKYFNHIKRKEFMKENPYEDYDYLLDNNYNDFYYDECKLALNSLKEFFEGLDLNNATIASLEYGFNLKVLKKPRSYIDYNFLLFEYKPPFNNYDESDKRFVKFKHNRFLFKVYDKSLQKGLKENIIRIEIVLTGTRLQEVKIKNIDDLLSSHKIEEINLMFTENFDKFLVIDNRFEDKTLLEQARMEVGNALEPSYWKNRKGKPNLSRYKSKFRELLTKNNLMKTKSYFNNLLNSKFEQLYYGVEVMV